MKNILVYTYSQFDPNCGGIIVQYELCRILDSLGINVRMLAPLKIHNNIFNKYYDGEFDLNNTVVIYGETIHNNPLNALYVVRWILAPIGIFSDINIHNTWNKNDLIYYFNSEEKISANPDKVVDNVYKLLPCIFIHPEINNNNTSRNGVCFTIRKASIYHKQINIIHPIDSLEINCTQLECIEIFKRYKYFISYDPLTFLSIISALCGCISIVVKVDGLSKQDWLNTLTTIDYFKQSEEKVLYGIAYGTEEIEFAKNTMHLVKEQWNKILQFSKDKYMLPFINDINNWEQNKNTVENNF